MKASRPLYRAVLKDAFVLTWKDKHLWPLGLFAAILLSGSAYDLLLRSWSSVMDAVVRVRYGLAVPEVFLSAFGFLATGAVSVFQVPFWAWLFLLVPVALWALVLWLSIVAQGALFSAVAAEEERKRPNLQAFFTRGMLRFWPLLGINALVHAGVTLILVPVALMTIGAVESQALPLLLGAITLFVFLIPAAYAIIVIGFFAALGVVRFRERFADAVRTAAALVRAQWLVVVETSAILLVLDIAVALVLSIGVTLFASTITGLIGILRLQQGAVGYWLLLSSYFLVVIGGVLVSVAALVTYHYAVWTLLAERIRAREPVVSKVLRFSRAFGTAMRTRRAAR